MTASGGSWPWPTRPTARDITYIRWSIAASTVRANDHGRSESPVVVPQSEMRCASWPWFASIRCSIQDDRSTISRCIIARTDYLWPLPRCPLAVTDPTVEGKGTRPASSCPLPPRSGGRSLTRSPPRGTVASLTARFVTHGLGDAC